MHAFLAGAADTFAVLLRRCDPATQDADGNTLLHMACLHVFSLVAPLLMGVIGRFANTSM
jgi:hypothetical protein